MKIAILNDTHAGIRNSSEIFIEQQELFYKTDVIYPDAKTYKENSISINTEREKYFREMGDKFRERFEQYGKKDAKGWKFSQVIRVNILKTN